jgi:hypothetical protein
VIKLQLLMSVVTFALWVYCLVGVIGTAADRVRNLPKPAWVLLVLLFPLVGSIAWLVAGRPADKARRATAAPMTRPERDRRVHERAEEQRRRHEQSRRSRDEQLDPSGPAGQPDGRQQAEEPGEPAGRDTGEAAPT